MRTASLQSRNVGGLTSHSSSAVEPSAVSNQQQQQQKQAPRVAHTWYRMQGCVIHRGIKTVGRRPSWCRLNTEFHKALAPFLWTCLFDMHLTSSNHRHNYPYNVAILKDYCRSTPWMTLTHVEMALFVDGRYFWSLNLLQSSANLVFCYS